MPAGRSNTLCVLHGWGFGGRALEKFTEGFEPDWHIKLLVLPGYDGAPPASPGIDGIAHALAPAVPDHSVVLGWSLGGMIGIRIASMKPLRKLVLLASTPCFIRKEGWPDGVEEVVIAGLRQRLKENTGKALHEFAMLCSRGDERPRATYRILAALLKDTAVPMDALLDGLEILRRADLRREFSGLHCPVAAVLGENDALVSAACAGAMLPLKPLLELHMIDGCGHAPFLSKPKQLRKILFNMLAPAPVT